MASTDFSFDFLGDIGNEIVGEAKELISGSADLLLSGWKTEQQKDIIQTQTQAQTTILNAQKELEELKTKQQELSVQEKERMAELQKQINDYNLKQNLYKLIPIIAIGSIGILAIYFFMKKR